MKKTPKKEVHMATPITTRTGLRSSHKTTADEKKQEREKRKVEDAVLRSASKRTPSRKPKGDKDKEATIEPEDKQDEEPKHVKWVDQETLSIDHEEQHPVIEEDISEGQHDTLMGAIEVDKEETVAEETEPWEENNRDLQGSDVAPVTNANAYTELVSVEDIDSTPNTDQPLTTSKTIDQPLTASQTIDQPLTASQTIDQPPPQASHSHIVPLKTDLALLTEKKERSTGGTKQIKTSKQNKTEEKIDDKVAEKKEVKQELPDDEAATEEKRREQMILQRYKQQWEAERQRRDVRISYHSPSLNLLTINFSSNSIIWSNEGG
jgi:hypothetical protein